MPKAVHDCAMDVQADGKAEDDAWAICNSQISEVATALGIAGVGISEEVPINVAEPLPDPDDYASHPTTEEVGITTAKALPDPDDYASHPSKETHNPLDIPFGYEVNEINKGVKDPEIEEGGQGSGRNPEGGDPSGAGAPGPLISFGETIFKEFVDAKVSCPCSKKN